MPIKDSIQDNLGAWSKKHGLTATPAWARISPDRSSLDQVNTISNDHDAQVSGQGSEDKSQVPNVTDVSTNGGKEPTVASNGITSQTPSTPDAPTDAGEDSDGATNMMSTPTPEHSHSEHQSENSMTIPNGNGSQGPTQLCDPGETPNSRVENESETTDAITITSSPSAGSSTSAGGYTGYTAPKNAVISSSPDSTPPAARSLATSDRLNNGARVAGVKRRHAVDGEGEVPSRGLSNRRRPTTQKVPSDGTYSKRLKAAGKRWEKMRAKALAPGASNKADVISAMASRTLPYCRDYGSIPSQATPEDADNFVVKLSDYGL